MLHTLLPLVRVTVVNRPSKTIKSPYVADVKLEDGSVSLCHTPGLSCSGLVSAGRVLYVSCAVNPAAKTAYTTQIAECTDNEGVYYVGIHPMISQMIASKLLDRISKDVVSWKSEVKLNEHTRIDFVGKMPSGKKVYVEVKNAMISLQTEKERSIRRAVFPEGYRKSKVDSFSPRAVKHAETLAELVKEEHTEAAYLLFIVPRDDCGGGLELNSSDPIYCNAVKKAIEAGVKVCVFGLSFRSNGEISFNKELDFLAPK